MRKKLSLLFIILGLAILVAPALQEWKADREQDKLLALAEQANGRDDLAVRPELAAGFERVSRLLGEEANEEPPAAEPEPLMPDADGKTPIATIEIPAIDLKLPVLEGATKANMKHAAAHMTETAPLGETGNAAIAAHRARTKGRLFNRLNEVKTGDQVVIAAETGRFVYEVYDISVVEPTDVSVLEPKGDDRILTLITCDPLKNPTHRLILHAKLLPENGKESQKSM
ncbi:class D sortase [uncultured Paenibacillus sp.]|uniref:class D sortase n=1 Tax=uncultured Paenibacillus sp. TaxID=227322 RepID=UPI0015ADA0EE|nr:class D sortase [uncultured Paenibacillus sp.]